LSRSPCFAVLLDIGGAAFAAEHPKEDGPTAPTDTEFG